MNISNVVFFIVGILFGAFSMAGYLTGHYKNQRVGKLRVDDSTGDTYMFMQLEVPPEILLQQKEIILEVDLSDITRD